MTAYSADGGAPDTRLELQLGGTWTDVASRTARDSQGIEADWTYGSADAAQSPDPASLAVTLLNDDGALTNGYPLSPWYGQLGQGTRARLSAAGSARLRTEDGGSAACPDTAALHAAGDIGVRIDCDLSDWQACIIIGKGSSWQLQLDADGLLGFQWNDGTRTWTAASLVQPLPGRRCLRAVLTVSTGIVTFYTGPAGGIDSGPWAQLGDTVNAGSGATSATTTGSLTVGVLAAGSYWEARLLIAGAVVANPSFASQAAGVTSFADGHSNTWTVNAPGEISDRDYRLHGEVASVTRTSPPPLARVAIAGPLRRLQRGSRPPVLSALRRAIGAQSGQLAPHAYWPMEDPSGSSQASSDLGGPPMICDPSRLPQFGSDSSFACSAALPQLGTTALRGKVPSYASHGSLACRFVLKVGASLGSPPVTGWPLVRVVIAGGTVLNLDLKVYSGWLLGTWGGNVSGVVFDSGSFNFGALLPSGTVQGSQLLCSLELTPSGGTVNWVLAVIYPGAAAAQELFGSFAGTVGRASDVIVHAGALSDTVVGHVQVQSAVSSVADLSQPLAAWAGELAAKRVIRLCAENGFPCQVTGAPGISAAMGPQAVAPLGTLLGQCQATDGGLLFEPREQFAVGYRTLASMLNQAPALTMDYAAAQVPPAPQAADDDTGLVNDWTVTSTAGDSARAVLDDGSAKSASVAGTYADTLSSPASVAAASQLPDIAGMMLARSTADGPRYPAVGAHLGLLGASAAAAAARVRAGDVVELVNVPAAVAPGGTVRQVTTGAEEQCGPGRSLDWNTDPAGAYDVAVLDDPVLGRLDDDGIALRLAATAAATTLAIVSAGLPVTTSAGDYPADVDIAGEQVTVTAAADGASGSATSPAAFHTFTSLTLPPGTWVIGWTVALSGTIAAAELNNFRLTDNTGATLATSVNAAAAGAYPQSPVTVTADGVTVTGIAIKSGANGATSGAVYTGTVTSPQVLTVTRAVNGISKAQAAGTAVTLLAPPVLAPI